MVNKNNKQLLFEMMKKVNSDFKYVNEGIDNREGRYKTLVLNLQQLGAGLSKATSTAAIVQYQKELEVIRKEMQAIEGVGIQQPTQQQPTQQQPTQQQPTQQQPTQQQPTQQQPTQQQPTQ